jgi:hypothetical protein
MKEDLKKKLNHMIVLMEEISIINKMIQPEDCGHMKTTVSFLKVRVDNIRNEIESAE